MEMKNKPELKFFILYILLLAGSITGKLYAQVNFGGFELIWVQGGSFNMGSNNGKVDEKPVHQVTLSGYYIGKYEVTQAQWQSIMGANPSFYKNCNNCPVEIVSWNSVKIFIQKLNQQTGKHFRLPTEAEWEFAARGGNVSMGYTYSGSNTIGSVAWYDINGATKTHPVGQKQYNELRIYDMTGNVWEWCSDYYNVSYYSGSPSVNPKGPLTGTSRVMRGGAWGSNADLNRVTGRNHFLPMGSLNNVGFRLAMDL